MSDRVPALLLGVAGGDLEAPSSLLTSEVTSRSFRATWTAPDGPVDKYRVTYADVAGGPPQEVRPGSDLPVSGPGSGPPVEVWA